MLAPLNAPAAGEVGRRPAVPRFQNYPLSAKFHTFITSLLVVAFWFPSLTSIGQVNLNVILLPLILPYAILRWPAVDVNARRLIYLPVILLLLVAALSSLSFTFTEQPFLVFRVLYSQIIALAAVMTIVALYEGRRGCDRIISLMAWGGSASSLIVLVAKFVPALGAVLFRHGDRTAAFFKHPNQFGMAIAMIAPVLVAQMITIPKKRKLRVLQLALIFVGLVLSGSKTNIGIFAVGCALSAVSALAVTGQLRRNPLVLVPLTLGTAVAAVGATALLSYLNPRAVRLMTAFATQGEIQSTGSRKVLWQQSLDAGLDRPFTGVGAGQPVNLVVAHSHNVFLDYFRTMGIPGLALVGGIVLSVLSICLIASIRSKYIASKSDRSIVIALIISCVSYILSNQLSDSFGPSTYPIFWSCVAMLALIASQARPGLAKPGQ